MSVTRAKRITSNAVKELRRDEILRDIELRGFGVRRREGVPSYFLQTRIKGRLKWITIGKHGQPWTPTSARKEALRLLQDISDGRDPVDKRKRQRTLPTLSEIAEDFMEDHGAKLKESTRGEYARLLRNAILPSFGSRMLNDITRADVTRFHSGMKATPRKANFALAVLSKIMSWCEIEGHRDPNSNPCRLIKKYREKSRQRFLSNEELERLGSVLSDLEARGEESPFVISAIRLLLLTGARLGEVLPLEWKYVDLQRSLIALPDSKTGQKTIFLNAAATATLMSSSGIASAATSSTCKNHGVVSALLPILKMCEFMTSVTPSRA